MMAEILEDLVFFQIDYERWNRSQKDYTRLSRSQLDYERLNSYAGTNTRLGMSVIRKFS